MLVDTHAHLDHERFGRDREDVILRAKAGGVEAIINVGCDISSSRKAVEFTRKYEGMYAAVGIHPHDAKDAREGHYHLLYDLAADAKVLAIGEIGLDYHYDFSPRDVQQRVFRRQLRLARELGKPVIIHNREAHADTLAILKEEFGQEGDEEGGKALRGVMHCFSGSLETAGECMRMGFYVSFGGPVTFDNARKLQELVKHIPLDRLLIETDCPYLTPEPHRGKRNEPAYVRYVAERVGELKGIAFEEIAQATTRNVGDLFRFFPAGVPSGT